MELGNVTNERTYTKKCPVCGEKFSYYPRWHQWLIKKGKEWIAVCRCNCMREVEKEQAKKEAERQRRLEERQETRNRREYEQAKRRASEPILKDKPLEWYEAQMAIAKDHIRQYSEDIESLKKSGMWYEMDCTLHKGYTAKVAYHERKLKRLMDGYEIVKKQKGYDT